MYQTSTISVHGADAFSFLQGQLSNDLRILESQSSIRAAWCNPKGRVITLMTVMKSADGYTLSVPHDLGDEIVKRLTMFKFRAKVEFDVIPLASETDAAAAIDAGIPWIGASQSEKFTPHMLNLDLLDAISLDKGCYTGQEVVARTHYKGATKRRTLKFETGEPVLVGDKVSDGERDIGEVLNAAGNKLLAILPTARANEPLTINGVVLQPLALPYPLS